MKAGQRLKVQGGKTLRVTPNYAMMMNARYNMLMTTKNVSAKNKLRLRKLSPVGKANVIARLMSKGAIF